MAIWGKIIGAWRGPAAGGPLGAVLGGVAGHVLDRWTSARFALVGRSGRTAGRSSAEAQRVAFATAVIVLAPSSPRPTASSAATRSTTFKEVFDVRDEDVGGIAQIFDEAKRTPDGFEPYARQIAVMFAYEPDVLEELLDQLFVLAAADGALDPGRDRLAGPGGERSSASTARPSTRSSPATAPAPRRRMRCAGARRLHRAGLSAQRAAMARSRRLAAAGARAPSRPAGGPGRAGGNGQAGQRSAGRDQRRL